MTTETASELFRALGSEPRLRILQALAEAGHQPMSSGLIAGHLSLGDANCSIHLRVLRTAGLVDRLSTGRFVMYKLVQARLDEINSFLAQLTWQTKLDDSTELELK